MTDLSYMFFTRNALLFNNMGKLKVKEQKRHVFKSRSGYINV